MNGSKLLKVSSILMTISGAFGLLSFILMVAIGSAVFDLLGIAGIGAIVISIVMIDTMIWGVLELVAGIFGAKNWNKPSQAKKCIAMAITIIALCLFINILTLGHGGGLLFTILSVILSLIIPTLYLIGAVRLNKSN